MQQSLSTIYVCSSCDAQSSKWSGRCLSCGSWGTISEQLKEVDAKEERRIPPSKTISLSDVACSDTPRLTTFIKELDQVLGGGIVQGSLILLGGEPGIGKSTLLLQIATSLASAHAGTTILYCSGEESDRQVRLRLDRLMNNSKNLPENLHFLGDTSCEKICATIESSSPLLAIVDSIQTISSSLLPSEPGNIAQVRACTVRLLETAKRSGVPIIITGHVTKEGLVAGPKTLEHLVDVVLYLEGDNDHELRLLKTVKNRFGSTNEVGVFEMTESGLTEVVDASSVFALQSTPSIAGTARTSVLEGSRAFIVHVQALTAKTYFGYPQRRTTGCDLGRLQLLIAVLSKRLGLNLGDQDIHLNIAGGRKISEPASDLAVCASIISAYKNTELSPKALFIGEVGLGGEVRNVSMLEKRLKEAEKLEFTDAFIPKQVKDISSKLTLHPLSHIRELEL